MTGRPAFNELPLRSGDPKYSAWGLWGHNDELGTLNHLSPTVTKDAVKDIVTGQHISLNLSIDAFKQPMNPVRKPCRHHIIAKGHANDDELHINTQGSSHWDGLRHYPYQDSLLYYNGVTQEDISGMTPNDKIGIQTFRNAVSLEEMMQWHWDNQFAAVASDTVAYEAWPSKRPAAVALHEVFLSGWGMPIGESFDLETLADKCREEGRWSFFVTSIPLDIPGGVASPPCAVAIL
ncbi:unnamed protein product [Fusarium graminearum]|nr:unnamed protein product [Fusarium graminearum]